MQTLQDNKATQANDNAVIGYITQCGTGFLQFFDIFSSLLRVIRYNYIFQ